jgi:KDO2-lipid IV(A) lauroyltransferase
MRARLVLWAYVAGWTLVKALPERLARRLFDLGADLGYRRGGKGVRRLRANLARVVPPEDLERVVRAGVRSYARYWLEAFRLPVMGRERLLRDVAIDHPERLSGPDGVVAVLPHMGNWDVAGAWASVTGHKLTTVAERLRPEELFDRFLAFRSSLGMEVVPLTGSAANPFDLLADRLRAGGLVCLLGDRDLTARGVEVTFFGETAKFPAGPAALAVRTGAALHPASLWFEGDGWHIRMHEAISVPDGPDRIRRMTQAVADVFEAAIREHPQDWHMLQRLWVADLVPR